MKVLIIIPAYNESANIVRVVDDLIKNYSSLDYVIINDGSSDNTAAICEEHHYNMIDLPFNLGLAGAFQTGLKYAVKHSYDYALQFDGDGQHDSSYIFPMLKHMQDNNLDIVIGSRFVSQQKPITLRMLGSILIEKSIYITTRCKLKDPTSGLRLLNKSMIDEFASRLNYGPEPDTIAYLLRKGIALDEIQVTMKERIAGTSYLNLRRSMAYMFRMVVSIVFIQFFRRR